MSDFYKLSEEEIKNYDDLYLDKLHKRNIFKNKDYKTTLYLLLKFFNGDIKETRNHSGPIVDDHESQIDTLKELAKNGILTSDGQCSIQDDEQRSYLELTIKLKSKDHISYIENIFKQLYDDNINIHARLYNIDDYIPELLNTVILINEDNYQKYNLNITNDEELLSLKEIPTIWVTEQYTHIPFIGESKYVLFDNGFNDQFEEGLFYTANIWSKNYDMTQVDEIFLKYWKEFLNQIDLE